MVCVCPLNLLVSCVTNTVLHSHPSEHQFLSLPSHPVHPARANACCYTQCIKLFRALFQQIERNHSQYSPLHTHTSVHPGEELAAPPIALPKNRVLWSISYPAGPQNSLLKLLLVMSHHWALKAADGAFPVERNHGGDC